MDESMDGAVIKMAFRVIMQKDHSREWQCTGMIALLGLEGGIDSHMRGNNSMTLNEALLIAGKLTTEEIEKVEKHIIAVCKRTCQVIDQYGRYGDVGIDVVLDTEYKPWVIEINQRHDHKVPLLLKDKQMYETMKVRVLEYAKVLAGF